MHPNAADVLSEVVYVLHVYVLQACNFKLTVSTMASNACPDMVEGALPSSIQELLCSVRALALQNMHVS